MDTPIWQHLSTLKDSNGEPLDFVMHRRFQTAQHEGDVAAINRDICDILDRAPLPNSYTHSPSYSVAPAFRPAPLINNQPLMPPRGL